MSRARIVLITATALMLGIAAGGASVFWAYNEFLLSAIAVSTPTAEAAMNLAVLKAIHDGQTDKAIRLLEEFLDGNLIGLSIFPEDRLNQETIAIVRRAAAYREAYPYSSPESAVAHRVSELLSKYNSNASTRK